MQKGMVDICLVGSDRTSCGGDVGNKIGTYLKALAAHDNGVPFYAAMPSSTIDWEIVDGVAGIPIEERGGEEVLHARGLHEGEIIEPLLAPQGAKAANYAFDVTPARLVTGIITERGISEASESGLRQLFPEF
jgi:methylthioribose-1-phosphate isomerase